MQMSQVRYFLTLAKNEILPVQLNVAACHSLHLQMRSSDWSRHLVDHYSTEIVERSNSPNLDGS